MEGRSFATLDGASLLQEMKNFKTISVIFQPPINHSVKNFNWHQNKARHIFFSASWNIYEQWNKSFIEQMLDKAIQGGFSLAFDDSLNEGNYVQTSSFPWFYFFLRKINHHLWNFNWIGLKFNWIDRLFSLLHETNYNMQKWFEFFQSFIQSSTNTCCLMDTAN